MRRRAVWGTGGDARRLRSSARSNPSSTQRWRMFSTVLVRHDKASAIRWSVLPGPSASACKRICARRTFSLLPLSLRIVCRQTSRSWVVSRTMYFFCGMGTLSVRDEFPDSPNVYTWHSTSPVPQKNLRRTTRSERHQESSRMETDRSGRRVPGSSEAG